MELSSSGVVESKPKKRESKKNEAEKVYKMRLRESNGAKYLGHTAAH